MHLILAIIDTFLETEYKETPENKALIEKINALDKKMQNRLNNEEIFDDLLEKWDRGEYQD